MRKSSLARPASASSSRVHDRRCNNDARPSMTFSAGTTIACAAAGSTLRGVDLVEQIAQSSSVQRQRWIEIYTKLWERRAKIDIADTIVLVSGTPRAWFFTSSTTGEIQKRHDDKLNATAIKKNFLHASNSTLATRHVAVLLHEDHRTGATAYSTLNELEFNAVLCQPSSSFWMASCLLQLLTPLSRQHPHLRGTFVAKFNALATTSCVRVLHASSYFYDVVETSAPAAAKPATLQHQQQQQTGETSDSPNGDVPSSPTPAAAASVKLSSQVEEIIKTELHNVVHEVERACNDKLRLFTGEFQITRSHRLVLVRVSHVVFFSDIRIAQSSDPRNASSIDAAAAASKEPRRRPASASCTRSTATPSTFPGAKRCAGGSFCHCKLVASAASLNIPLPSAHEFQRITRKSLSLSDDESLYLTNFGAHAEATLAIASLPMRAHDDAHDDAHAAFTKLLQRRVFMLQSTLWNPKSDAFKVQSLEFAAAKKLPQQYEMTQVCKTCYLIYHTIDTERFHASRTTSKAAARLYNAKLLSTRNLATQPAEGDGAVRAVPVATLAHNGAARRSPFVAAGAGSHRLRAWGCEASTSRDRRNDAHIMPHDRSSNSSIEDGT